MRHIGLSSAIYEVTRIVHDLSFLSLWSTDQMSVSFPPPWVGIGGCWILLTEMEALFGGNEFR